MKKIPSRLKFFLGWRLVFAIIYVTGFYTAKTFIPETPAPVFSETSVFGNVTVVEKSAFDMDGLINDTMKTTPEK